MAEPSAGLLSQETQKAVIDELFQAQSRAFCPYSKFPVGSVVITDDNQRFQGCNVENAAYSVGICAERTAMSFAVGQGHRKFKAIFVIGGKGSEFLWPCGVCRQFINEFGADILIYSVKSDRSTQVKAMSELLPCSFKESDLKR